MVPLIKNIVEINSNLYTKFHKCKNFLLLIITLQTESTGLVHNIRNDTRKLSHNAIGLQMRLFGTFNPQLSR